jgi:hypothetical protein
VLHEAPHTVCSFFSDAEFIERDVLSAWILNREVSSLQESSDLRLKVFGETRPRWLERAQHYRAAVERRSQEALDRYRVRYAVNECMDPPTAETGAWRELARGGRWCIWERAWLHAR